MDENVFENIDPANEPDWRAMVEEGPDLSELIGAGFVLEGEQDFDVLKEG
jgi:hypothetical protein